MKRSTLLIIGFALGLGLLIAVFQTFSFSEFLEIFLNLDGSLVLAYLSVSFLMFLLLAYRWKVVTQAHGTPFPFLKAVAYRYVGNAVSFVTPGPRVGGEPVRAALLARHGMTFPKAFSTVVADKTIELSSWGTMIVLGVTIALFTIPLSMGARLALGIPALIIFALIAYGFSQMIRGRDPILRLFKLLRLHRIKALRKYEKELQEFEKNILAFYGRNAKAFWWAQTVSAAVWLISLLEFKLVLLMLGIDANLIQLLLVYSVVGIAYLIPIPLALGVLEAGQASLFIALGFSAAGGAFLAMMTRARDLLWTLIGFIILTYLGVDIIRTDETR